MKLTRVLLAMTIMTMLGREAETAHAAPPTLEVGQPVPDLVLPVIKDGSPMSLADFAE